MNRINQVIDSINTDSNVTIYFETEPNSNIFLELNSESEVITFLQKLEELRSTVLLLDTIGFPIREIYFHSSREKIHIQELEIGSYYVDLNEPSALIEGISSEIKPDSIHQSYAFAYWSLNGKLPDTYPDDKTAKELIEKAVSKLEERQIPVTENNIAPQLMLNALQESEIDTSVETNYQLVSAVATTYGLFFPTLKYEETWKLIARFNEVIDQLSNSGFSKGGSDKFYTQMIELCDVLNRKYDEGSLTIIPKEEELSLALKYYQGLADNYTYTNFDLLYSQKEIIRIFVDYFMMMSLLNYIIKYKLPPKNKQTKNHSNPTR